VSGLTPKFCDKKPTEDVSFPLSLFRPSRAAAPPSVPTPSCRTWSGIHDFLCFELKTLCQQPFNQRVNFGRDSGLAERPADEFALRREIFTFR
jgi:hypothetical protein